MNTDMQTDLPALHKPKWACFYLYNTSSSNNLIKSVYKLNISLVGEKLIDKFIVLKGGTSNEILFLTYQTSHYKLELFVKEKVSDYFKNYYNKFPKELELDNSHTIDNRFFTYKDLNIDVEENYVHYGLSAGGWDVFEHVTSELLFHSSLIISNFIIESDQDWDVDKAIEKQIPLIIILLHSFKLTKDEVLVFLQWFWEKMVSFIDFTGVQDKDAWYEIFFNGVKNNYTNQGEPLIAYVEYVYEILSTNQSVDEEWFNSWTKVCADAFTQLDFFIKNNQYQFTDENLSIAPKWLMLEQMIHAINHSLDINAIYEFNVMYSLKESIADSGIYK